MVWVPDSRLYRDAFLVPREGDPHSDQRAALQVGLTELRARADALANRIETDLPEFTEHDGSHLDALWGLCDVIAPIELELSALEAFVLGGAIVVHDLGLPIAAYPGGREQLRNRPEWLDALATRERWRLGRAASIEELEAANDELRIEADRDVLRARHAEQAVGLPTQAWQDSEGEKHYLIENEDRRKDLGHLIGQIAASHWWPTEELDDRLPRGGVRPGVYPAAWELRPLVLACLLRIADAAHLDGRRAPRWTRVHRHLGPVSRMHWDFQERIGGAELDEEHDALRFGSLTPFGPQLAGAWWTCLDALRVLDNELRGVDRVLAQHRLPRLRARTVLGVERPEQLAVHVRTEGWTPVDARVEVSDVAKLIEQLGGQALYGDVSLAPLRELLANATDAVRARAALDGRPQRGVEVRRWSEGSSHVLEVYDEGMGMSATTLAGVLLDFGRSLWTSSELVTTLPGLASSGFQPVGRFGIGFFSVFMWTDRVSVISRPFRAGETDTRVLEFAGGVRDRPLLRTPAATEARPEGGTTVRLGVDAGGLAAAELDLDHEVTAAVRPDETASAAQRAAEDVAWLAPALDADIDVVIDGQRIAAVRAGDWLTMDGTDLLVRITGGASRPRRETDVAVRRIGRCMRTIEDHAGTAVARAALVPERWKRDGFGVLTVSGLRAKSLKRIAGIWSAMHPNVARTDAQPATSPAAVAEWATGQATLWADALHESEHSQLAADVLALGGDTGPLKVIDTADGPLANEELVDWLNRRDTVYVIDVVDAIEQHNEQGFVDKDAVAALPDDSVDLRRVNRLDLELGQLAARRQPVSDPGEVFIAALVVAWEIDQSILPEAPASQFVTFLLGDDEVEAEAEVYQRPQRPGMKRV